MPCTWLGWSAALLSLGVLQLWLVAYARDSEEGDVDVSWGAIFIPTWLSLAAYAAFLTWRTVLMVRAWRADAATHLDGAARAVVGWVMLLILASLSIGLAVYWDSSASCGGPIQPPPGDCTGLRAHLTVAFVMSVVGIVVIVFASLKLDRRMRATHATAQREAARARAQSGVRSLTAAAVFGDDAGAPGPAADATPPDANADDATYL